MILFQDLGKNLTNGGILRDLGESRKKLAKNFDLGISKMVDTNDVMSQHVVEDPVSDGDAFDSGDVNDEFEFDDPVLNGVRSAERLKCYIHHQESFIFDALMNAGP